MDDTLSMGIVQCAAYLADKIGNLGDRKFSSLLKYLGQVLTFQVTNKGIVWFIGIGIYRAEI